MIKIISVSQIINVDQVDTSFYTKKAIWNVQFSLGLELDKRILTLWDVSNSADASLQKNKELFIVSASERLTYDTSYSLNTGYIHLRWRHDFKNAFHEEAFTQYQWDQVLGMMYRFVSGGNLRYNFWHKKSWEMTFASGVMYENERWNYASVDPSHVPVNAKDRYISRIRSNNYIKLDGKPSAITDITIAVFYQSSFNDFFKPRIFGSVNLEVDVSKHFALNFMYNSSYDAAPVVPIYKFYYGLSNSITYKL